MRAHDKVDLVRPDPEPGEIGDEGRALAMELRPGRAFLVVADAAVDQDRMMPVRTTKL
jgi:hypothetical protein